MRKAVFVIGLIGAIGALFLGFTWLWGLNSMLTQWGELSSQMASWLDSSFLIVKITAYTLIICGICGLIFSIRVLFTKGKNSANGVMLVVAGILPILFATKAIFGLPMILAGILAFAIEPEKPVSTNSDT